MIEKSPEMKMYERSDALMQEFRDSVRRAQASARDAGVAAVFVVNGLRYLAMPDGTITAHDGTNGGITKRSG